MSEHWTVIGAWMNDEAIPVATLKGDHVIYGDIRYDIFEQGTSATGVVARTADEAEELAAAEMEATL